MTRAPGSYAGLTVKQAEALSFIRHEAKEGRTPSYREIGSAVGIGTISGAHRLVSALVERGYVRRIPNRPRSIMLVDGAPTIDQASITELLAELSRRGQRVQLAGVRA